MTIARYVALFAAAAVAGCNGAKASQYDSANPVHCATIFSVTSGTIKRGALADELNARIIYIAQANGGPQWLQKVTPAAREIAIKWQVEDQRDQVLTLFEHCRNLQDADPNFRAAFPNLLREGGRISSSAL